MSRLFLGNIPRRTTASEISNWTQSHGFIVTSVDIIADRDTGVPRGFCFATLIDDKQTDSAIHNLNGKLMGGRVITVNHAVPLKSVARQMQRRSAA